jgi:predicted amidohydrolase
MGIAVVKDLGTLTSAGLTTVANMEQYDSAVFTVTVANVGASVTVRMEGSLDSSNWFNLDAMEEDSVLAGNGTAGFSIQNAPIPFLRGRLVSISGGTPSVTFKVALSN